MSVFPRWWREHFLYAELGVAVFASIAFITWVDLWRGDQLVFETLRGNRGAIYGALASIFGSLLGFAITAVSIVLGFSSSKRLAIVRESKHYSTLWKVFTAAIRTLGLATAVALVGLVIDRDNAPNRQILYLCVFASSLAALRLARCVWVLENIIGLITAPSKARPSTET
jgi:hypothetical protein